MKQKSFKRRLYAERSIDGKIHFFLGGGGARFHLERTLTKSKDNIAIDLELRKLRFVDKF